MTAATHLLQPHPATPCATVDSIDVAVAFDADSSHPRLTYVLAGDLARLRVPGAAAQPGPTDGLWRHTCFEAFIGPASAPDYREFNFAPSGHWAAYAFSAERVPASASMPIAAPRIVCERDARGLRLQALLVLPAPLALPRNLPLVIPAKAGIQTAHPPSGVHHGPLDSRFRGNDGGKAAPLAFSPAPVPQAGEGKEGSPLRLGLAAVIETTDGALSYWALAHPAARPDFHRREGWTLQLNTP
jgi:hypothetical protein